jgi:hypothetical protein
MAGAARTAAADVAGYQAVAVGQDEQQRKEAEQACLTAAAAQSTPAGAAGVESAGEAAGAAPSLRPSKRLKQHLLQTPSAMPGATAGAAACPSSAVSLSVVPGAQFVSYLLGVVRAAGALGVTTEQVAHLVERNEGGGGGGSAPAAEPPVTPASDGEVGTAQQVQTAQGTAAAAVASLPVPLQQQPAVAAASGLRLLQKFGLLRKMSGWQDKVWMSAEDSQRMLACPIPKQQQQQACPDPSAQPGAPHQDTGEGPPAADALPSSQTAAPFPAAAAAAGFKSNAAASIDEVPTAPWLDHKGCLNRGLWQQLVKRVIGVVLRNPGIPEPLLLAELDVVTPAAAAELLGALVQQGHLLCRTIANGTTGAGGDAGGWVRMGGVVAVRLGAEITGCTPAPALPPSLLIKRQPVAAVAAPGGDRQEAAADQSAFVAGSRGAQAQDQAAGAHDTGSNLQQQQGRVDVLHYWASLSSSTTCHLTCLPLKMMRPTVDQQAAAVTAAR